ncbi:CRTAC1 family protein [bacterium]|nr:CRTAC1 family protein [Verrucomicrobiales bacterium]MDC3254936.1 CRTAC1 family protein [bacterium]
MRIFFLAQALAFVLGQASAQELPPDAQRILQERAQLDRSVWKSEKLAQSYERAITRLWDDLRSSDSPSNVFKRIACDQWAYPSKATQDDDIGLGITRTRYSEAAFATVDRTGFASILDKHQSEGLKLVESEFHHTSFQPETLSSTISFLLHLETPAKRLAVTGEALVIWNGEPDKDLVRAKQIRVQSLKVLSGQKRQGFVKAATFTPRKNEFQSAHPVLLHDLDHDGDTEIIIPRWNRRYDNQLATKKPTLADASFLTYWQPQEECGLIADITADGIVDYVTVTKNSGLTLYKGASGGTFPTPGIPIFRHPRLLAPLAMTAGDIDRDGDLDLWITQYKPSYVGGQMPTPFYNANDGHPSFLLRNDDGHFVDITEASGLAAKRFRRTYSTSFVDLDRDDHLDLLVVSDYAGLDVYRNQGNGTFTDISESFTPNRLFGMAHSLADYNLDGELDLLAIGMSSSTARRLDSFDAGIKNRPDYQTNRAAMGYGNRMYLRQGEGFVESPQNAQIARTGWSWGVSAFDFENDGDRDLYIANGFRSGQSSKDYCTNYWCHDLYTGESKENPNLIPVFSQAMLELNQGLSSWNGFEHNHLKLNLAGEGFENVAFLFGASFEYDARVVLTEDFDRDGREDLLVSEYPFVGRGFQSKVHLYLNRLPLAADASHWIEILLRPSPGRSVIGALITLKTTKDAQIHAIVAGDSFLSQDAYTAHFGLGSQTKVDQVNVRWPGGDVSIFNDPEIDRVHVVDAKAH